MDVGDVRSRAITETASFFVRPRMWAATRSPLSTLRHARTVVAPAPESPKATSRPMPELPPVTTAVLPLMLSFGISNLSALRRRMTDAV
eukprot:1030317-Prymnesium_polylepis.1